MLHLITRSLYAAFNEGESDPNRGTSIAHHHRE
jgi:hypothetical protein